MEVDVGTKDSGGADVPCIYSHTNESQCEQFRALLYSCGVFRALISSIFLFCFICFVVDVSRNRLVQLIPNVTVFLSRFSVFLSFLRKSCFD